MSIHSGRSDSGQFQTQSLNNNQKTSAGQPAPVPVTAAKVLTVTRSERDHCRLVDCFKGAGWSLKHALDVRSSAELLSTGEIDVVISDVDLPDGSWLDLLHCSGRIPKRPPVVVATDTLEPRLWAEALSCGAYDVLAKPFNTREVLHVVRSAWLAHVRGQDGRQAAERS
jgi:DNA-binding NtrC family response regulator